MFKKIGDISSLNGGTLKLVNKFTFLGSSVSSAENDINMHVAKSWTTLDCLSIIWKSDLSVEIKRNFFPTSGSINSTIWMHLVDADKAYRVKARQELHKNATSYIEQIQEATSFKTAAVRLPTSHL